MDTTDRNILFSNYTNMIKRSMNRNRLLIYALRLDREDVYQELSMAVLAAIDSFDPKRSTNMDAHVWMNLKFKILSFKRQYRPGGITGLNGARPRLISVESLEELGHPILAGVDDILQEDQLRQALARLEPREREVVILYLEGISPRHKADKAVFTSALQKLRTYYLSAFGADRVRSTSWA